MGNLTKPVIGMIGLLSKVMVYWSPDGKQSKLIKTKINALRHSSTEQKHFRSAMSEANSAGMKADHGGR